MLHNINRLRKMKDIEILFKEGRFVGGELVTIKYWNIAPDKYPRRKYTKDMLKIAFIVGKKVSKSAVQRNRVKRQMREVVRLLLKDDAVRAGVLVAVIAKPAILGSDYKNIEKSIVDTFRKARLFK